MSTMPWDVMLRAPCVKIIVSPHLSELEHEWKQVRFPRSKKKRIRKKWAKNRMNFVYRFVGSKIFRSGDSWLVSPRTYNALKEQLRERI